MDVSFVRSQFFVEFIAVVTLVAIVNYWLLFPTFIMSLLFYVLRHIYINTARSIKRLEALSEWRIIYTETNLLLSWKVVKGFELGLIT